MRPKSVFAVMHGDVLWNSVLKAFYSGAYLQKPDSPNFNPAKLVKETCTLLAHQFMNQYNLTKFHFYVTNKDDEAKSTGLWDKLLRSMPNLCKNIDYKDYTYCYPVEDAYNRNGAYFRGYTKINPRIHVQMALDLVLGAINKEYDATLLFVDNPVYLEVVSAVKIIAKNQQRFVEIFVAHPVPPEQLFSDRVQEILLNRELYNRCILKHLEKYRCDAMKAYKMYCSSILFWTVCLW